MKEKRLLYAIGWVKDEYIEEMSQPGSGKKVHTIPRRRMWLIAAIIALALLLVGCAVVYVLRLQNMKIGEEVITEEAWTGPSGEYVPPTEWVNIQLSLQGYNGSPEQKALREWLDFQELYDPDGTLMKANNLNESGVPEQYYITYNCYTFEMMDKLNEILDKYQLKPLGAWMYFSKWETPLFYQALQIDNLSQSSAGSEKMAGYFAPEGSFQAEFRQRLEGEEEERIVSFTYAQNGYFYPYYSIIRDIELWEQWNYTTMDGADVLLATYQNALVIICDCGNGFIHITTEHMIPNAPFDNTAEPMTRQKAEQIADSFCYDIQPQPCDPDQVEAMRADYPAPEQPHFLLEGFTVDIEADRYIPPEGIGNSFEQYIAYVLENKNAVDNPNVDQLDYCVADLNQDGQQEVLLRYRDTGKYWQIIQMGDAPDNGIFIRFINGNVYEGPAFECITKAGKWSDFDYYELKDADWKVITCLRYDPQTQSWSQSSSSGTDPDAQWQTISESEAEQIRSAYTPISLEWKPLTEFSMNG